MLFNSIDFLVFFPIVVLMYYVIPKRVRYIWLLIASYVFYMSWEPMYGLLLGGVTICSFVGGILIHRAKNESARKATLIASIVINILVLCVFKYLDFGRELLNSFLSLFNITVLEGRFNILLPVGISFYTFQAMGYLIDVYRKKIRPEKNLYRFALFVSFFPQLVAGPIERSENLLRQMKEMDKKSAWNYQNVADGLTMMVWGMFIKMVIADRVAILVETVFDGFYFCGACALIVGALGFAVQIYCDFCGYSTIAVGAAKVLGFTLTDNFNTPYFACSISDFWKRWHISLSTWFRDYLYIPLGGNRGSKGRKYLNICITMGVSGLWHGANLTFVVWGVLHGVYQVIGDLTREPKRKLYESLRVKTESFSFRFAQGLTTFLLVDLAWIFFRADSLTDAFVYCKRIVTKWDPWSLFNGQLYELGLDRFEMNVLFWAMVLLLLVDLLKYIKKQTVVEFLNEQCIWFKWGCIIALVMGTLVYGIYGIWFESSRFLYFQF